jgi:hypothetical protein
MHDRERSFLFPSIQPNFAAWCGTSLCCTGWQDFIGREQKQARFLCKDTCLGRKQTRSLNCVTIAVGGAQFGALDKAAAVGSTQAGWRRQATALVRSYY